MNTLNRIILTCLFFCLGFSLFAQTIKIKCILPEDGSIPFHYYVQPMGTSDPNSNVELIKDSLGIFNAIVPVNDDNLYHLYIVSQQMQQAVPFYLPEQKRQEILQFKREGETFLLPMDADNRALSSYNAFQSRSSRHLWEQGKNMNSQQLLSLLKSYKTEAERLIQKNNCSTPVRRFLTLNAYTSAYGDYMKLDFITHKRLDEIGFGANDFLEKPEKMLDCPMAKYFFPTHQIILSTVPKVSIEDQILFLRNHYKNEDVIQTIEDALLELFLSQFDYDGDYQAGENRLKALTEKYHLNHSYLKKFKGRRYARKGASFPTDITLLNAKGEKVDFAQFKGYYVYIDLWASWCVPCCKEVPYLQELEKSVDNPKLKFVSISTDSHLPAWQKKMKALNMSGYQLIEPHSELVEALNISGIPHFLIYDPEGKLLYYKAPRPSTGAPLKSLLEHLQ